VVEQITKIRGGGYFPDMRTQKDPDRLRLWDQVTYPDGGQT